jgi:hypothetical protein
MSKAKELLEKYGMHLSGCYGDTEIFHSKCTCGYSQALAALEEPPCQSKPTDRDKLLKECAEDVIQYNKERAAEPSQPDELVAELRNVAHNTHCDDACIALNKAAARIEQLEEKYKRLDVFNCETVQKCQHLQKEKAEQAKEIDRLTLLVSDMCTASNKLLGCQSDDFEQEGEPVYFVPESMIRDIFETKP